MAVSLSYHVAVDEYDEVEYKPLFRFYTQRISRASTAAREKAVQNEVEAGNVFADIKSHKVFSIVIPGAGGLNSRVVHSLMKAPKNVQAYKFVDPREAIY